MLLDILNISKLLSNVLRSVSDNTVELAWVLYLFIATVVIYAQFGLQYFEPEFTYDDGSDGVGCHSVVSCSFLIFYKGAWFIQA
jgi:hypothetical protein